MKHYTEIGSKEDEFYRDKVSKVRNYFMASVAISMIGFSLPWFKFGATAQWWYGGWRLMVEEGLPWIGLIYTGYLMLIVLGYFIRESDEITGLVGILSLVVVFSTFIVAAIAAGDAIDGVRTLYRVEWNIGYFLMLPGHALMVGTAFAAWVYKVMKEQYEALA